MPIARVVLDGQALLDICVGCLDQIAQRIGVDGSIRFQLHVPHPLAAPFQQPGRIVQIESGTVVASGV